VIPQNLDNDPIQGHPRTIIGSNDLVITALKIAQACHSSLQIHRRNDKDCKRILFTRSFSHNYLLEVWVKVSHTEPRSANGPLIHGGNLSTTFMLTLPP
jgi:hypothetical protein